MTMLRWEPLSSPRPVGRYIHRFFDDMFWANRTFSATNGGARTLALDMYEGADEVVVKAALPGVEPDDVQITVEDGRLAIRAKVPGDAGDKGGRWLRQERLAARRPGARPGAGQLPPWGLDPAYPQS